MINQITVDGTIISHIRHNYVRKNLHVADCRVRHFHMKMSDPLDIVAEAWGEAADRLVNDFTKDDRVIIHGRLANDNIHGHKIIIKTVVRARDG